MGVTRNWNDSTLPSKASRPPAPTGSTLERRARRRQVQLVLLNLLSLSRLGFAVAFPLVTSVWARAGLVVAAALSDFLDGWIARRARLTSRMGALVDPFADRVFVVTALTTWLVEGHLSLVEYSVLLVRDLATALGYLVARVVPSLRAVEFKARLPGKIVTTLQLAVLLAVPLAPVLVTPLVLATGLTALYAVMDYSRTVWRARAV